MSSSILERLNAASDVFGAKAGDLGVADFPYWPPGEKRKIPPSALTVKILCERHNNALSPLDSEGARFFDVVDNIASEFKTQPGKTVYRLDLFSGHDIDQIGIRIWRYPRIG